MLQRATSAEGMSNDTVGADGTGDSGT